MVIMARNSYTYLFSRARGSIGSVACYVPEFCSRSPKIVMPFVSWFCSLEEIAHDSDQKFSFFASLLRLP